MTVVKAGVLSLLQDSGRRGHYRLGLTDGGPADVEAYNLCNKLLQNPPGSTAVEVTLGGLQLRAEVDTTVCVTGAPMPFTCNGKERDLWTVHTVKAGDILQLAHTRRGARAYLGVAGGFQIPKIFGSSATVVRESLGGLKGQPLTAGDVLPCDADSTRRSFTLPRAKRPRYQNRLTVRVIPCYQHRFFERLEKRRFFSFPYTVGERSDRMGYRLEGASVACKLDGIVSEGIAPGAIQIPSDGQPIVLLCDRQTIGGYPKIGTALSLDIARLSQLTPGATVNFAPISRDTAQRVLKLADRFPLHRAIQAT